MKLQRPGIITSIHNPMAYELSNHVGHYASRTRLIEVIWNTLGGLRDGHYSLICSQTGHSN